MRGTRSLRTAILLVALALAWVVGLSVYKSRSLETTASEAVADLSRAHQKILSQFQASFFFFYEDQFLPAVKEATSGTGDASPRRIRILSSEGALLFDSKNPSPTAPDPGKAQPLKDEGAAEVLVRLKQPSTEPAIYRRGFDLDVLMPSGQYGILYSYEGAGLKRRMAIALVVGLLAIGALGALLTGERARHVGLRLAASWRGFWRLRTQFLATIVAINIGTAAILFFSLTALQTHEQTERIRRESVQFSEFSTAQVVSDFTNYFYFYFSDRFLPGVRRIVASNENLQSLKIISRRTNTVLFDSDQVAGSSAPVQLASTVRADLGRDVEEELATRDLVFRQVSRDGHPSLRVINTYRDENQEPLFWVEYVFGFQTLERSVAAIRRQILLDLGPALALSLLIAAIFAQLLISPIRRLVSALRRVSAGDYEVSIEVSRADEVGDLVGAFNTMTQELRKKKELRKYLSDSTYRQIMQAPDTPGGARVGGSRVQATILFCDIRGFVTHCEHLAAEEVTAMLNEYFSEMVEVVHKHGGEVDKFIGDALLAVFYASDEVRAIRPADAPQGPTATATALQAIYCGIEMRERLAEFNTRRKAARKREIEIGIGISHGEIISGPIGSKDRMDFTVIGDVVNLASRIEKLSKAGKHTRIVFSNHVEERVRGLLDCEEIDLVAANAITGDAVGGKASYKIRGKDEDVRVYELIGIRDLQSLRTNLEKGDAALRRRSVELLGQSRNPEAMPWLVRALSDEDEGTRLAAAQAVSKLAPQDEEIAINALLAQLAAEREEKVISGLIAALGRICTTERILAISRFLEHPNERIVANTIEALGQVRSARANDLILPKLGSRNNRIKANAAMALFAAGHVEVIDMLKPMLMHSDALMRSSAAFAIGELTVLAGQNRIVDSWRDKPAMVKQFLAELQECVPMLVACLRDVDSMVRRQSVLALGKIKDRSAVLPMIEMIDGRPENQAARELLQDISQALNAIGSHRLVRDVIAKLSSN